MTDHDSTSRGQPISGFAHVCIGSTELAETRRFYCEGLGAEHMFNFVRDEKVIGYYLKIADRNFIEVFQRDAIDTEDNGPINHICLEVSDIDRVSRCLRASGYEISEKECGADNSWQAWTSDPDGVEIEFHEYTEDSTQMTGQDCSLD